MQVHQLPIPAAVDSDPRARELIGIWVAHGKQHISIATDVWEDPAAWGIMLVDLMKHLAVAYEQSTGSEYGCVLRRIREGFDVEWETPTDEP
jgi:hypothetical protein